MEPLTIQPRSPSPPQGGGLGEYTPPSQRESAPFPPEENESFIVEIFKFAILALVIVVPFRFFVAQPFIVSGASMAPTFETGQYLIVDQLTYQFEAPKRGDVVIFRYPNDPSKYFIKRLIGLPGEVVELANGATTVKDPGTNTSHTLEEPYVKTDLTDDHLTITLSSDEYFVMGDNRGASSDSRVWGPVPRKNIVGRALLRLLPPKTFSVFPGEYTQGQLSAFGVAAKSS
jgi:signal peptidase I